ncbi:MAG: aldolase catalytic domain-containing protein [Spirochaetes bacterium]|nr:aldolase catalytic domain-containing protein [Spirochaetota bacterium]
MYRPEIKVTDCTIRDGGLMNDSKFPTEVVKAVYKAICDSGVDIVELGYRNSKKLFSPEKYGLWRFCDDDVLKKVVSGIKPKNTKLAIMMDAHKSDAEDIKPKKESPVDIIRVATYVKDIDKAIHLVNDAAKKGYDTTINIMAISHTVEWELDEALQQIEAETKILACYIVDSFGSLYSEDIDFYYDKYRKYIKTKEIGIHCHNHQQLAFANTIEGIIKGANYLDATLYGIGRAAGNAPLELLISFLKNPKFNIIPVLEVIGKYILPLKEEMEWGYHVPYMIAGIMNIHPDEAMKLMALDKKDPARTDFKAFYEKCADLV